MSMGSVVVIAALILERRIIEAHTSRSSQLVAMLPENNMPNVVDICPFFRLSQRVWDQYAILQL